MKSTQILLSLCLSLLIWTSISAQVIHTKDHTPTVTTYTKEFHTARPTTTTAPAQALQPIHYYQNTKGNTIQAPTLYNRPPLGATALCRDGTYSFSQNRSGTCSHHGGVEKWL